MTNAPLSSYSPFDMRVQNELVLYHLVQDVIARVPHLRNRDACRKQIEHKIDSNAHEQHTPEVLNGRGTP